MYACEAENILNIYAWSFIPLSTSFQKVLNKKAFFSGGGGEEGGGQEKAKTNQWKFKLKEKK